MIVDLHHSFMTVNNIDASKRDFGKKLLLAPMGKSVDGILSSRVLWKL